MDCANPSDGFNVCDSSVTCGFNFLWKPDVYEKNRKEVRHRGALVSEFPSKWRFGYFWSPSLGSQCLVNSTDGGWQVYVCRGKSSQILTHGHQCLMGAEVATKSPVPFKRFLTPNYLGIEQGIQFTATTCQYYYNPWLAEHHSWNMPTTIALFCQCRSRYWFEEC